MYRKYYHSLNEDLNLDQVIGLANFMLSEKIRPEESASLLTALNFYKDKGLLLEGFSKAIKSHSIKVDKIPGSIDVCGTGGDGHNTFNISTTVSILLSLVMPVIKHGNTSVSSNCGSADVIKSLNIGFPNKALEIQQSLIRNNFVFLYAPFIHPAMKHVMTIRKKLGIPTIFNQIGPLCNPFHLDYQIIGVYDEDLLLPMAKALQASNIVKGAVVHGHQGMDELSTSGVNKIIYVTKKQLTSATINPFDYNISKGSLSDYQGGTKEENARITYDILKGTKGPKQDIVALNAGLGLYLSGHKRSLAQGIRFAYELLNSKKGLKALQKLSGGSNEYSK